MQNTIGYVGFDVGDKWAEIYLKDALSRVGSQIEGLNLTITDLFEMQELCAFEVEYWFHLTLHSDTWDSTSNSFQ